MSKQRLEFDNVIRIRECFVIDFRECERASVIVTRRCKAERKSTLNDSLVSIAGASDCC